MAFSDLTLLPRIARPHFSRAGLIELGVWTALYGAFAVIMAMGATNGLGYFQQPNGVSLWAPLALGGAVNAAVIYLHAFKAMPLLRIPGRRTHYIVWLGAILILYLSGHLFYQLVLAHTLQPSLREISIAAWTVENLYAAPGVLIVSALYKVARDWAANAAEREGLLQRTDALEGELRLIKQEVEALRERNGVLPTLKFQSSRERVQTPLHAIIYVKAAGNYVEIVTADRTYTVYSSIRNLRSQLPEEMFAQIHRSYVVNLSHVESIARDEITIGGAALPLSQAHRATLKALWDGRTES